MFFYKIKPRLVTTVGGRTGKSLSEKSFARMKGGKNEIEKKNLQTY